ncbi:serine/threonine-protein kinase pakF-like isoform X3 [Dysidea avara]|uniref:serine/threonine-protein kinase pakF-like isoform X3 n=1 Tax=Dysidea avara TaxID=196820 RepID=UPI00332E0030
MEIPEVTQNQQRNRLKSGLIRFIDLLDNMFRGSHYIFSCPVQEPNICEEPVGVRLKSASARGDKVPKDNQRSSRNKKQSKPALLTTSFQPSLATQDGGSHRHVGRVVNIHIDSTPDCAQALEYCFEPEQPDTLQKCDFINAECEPDKHGSAATSTTAAAKSIQRDHLQLHSDFLDNDCVPGGNSGTEPAKSVQKKDDTQLDTVNLAWNNQNSIDCHPSYSNTIKSRHKTGIVTDTSTAMKTPQYQDHNWTRDNAVVVDVPHKHGKTKEKNEATFVAPSKPQYYNKATYIVLIGDSVKPVNTKLYASLPVRDKYMVKERIPGTNKVKLVLKSSDETESEVKDGYKQVNKDEIDGLVPDGIGERLHHRENCRNPGYIIFTCDIRFNGNTKYPTPSGRATDNKIGKGGNGFVFIMFHERKQYAVKKTVYRPNEVNVHAALKHENILPLLAVLMGDRHERHSSKFYCFHFMPKMDYDLRQILSAKEIGCLKHLYVNCSKDLEKFKKAFNNVKFMLKEVLKALAYLHSNGYVHRDVKASNIMIKMRCKCNPLYCNCSSKFQVKLGDFDSAGTVPGLGIKEPTDQMIKFASILPLGTPGYRAPEVSMHITLSGPYETLYTFAVDMWSFGCLCLNICIGKTAALRQREEASLLLSKIQLCFKELWQKNNKDK